MPYIAKKLFSGFLSSIFVLVIGGFLVLQPIEAKSFEGATSEVFQNGTFMCPQP